LVSAKSPWLSPDQWRFALSSPRLSRFQQSMAGYHTVLGLSQIGVPSLLWREVFAWIGAIMIGRTAWARMTILAEPLPLRLKRAAPDNSQRVLTVTTGEG